MPPRPAATSTVRAARQRTRREECEMFLELALAFPGRVNLVASGEDGAVVTKSIEPEDPLFTAGEPPDPVNAPGCGPTISMTPRQSQLVAIIRAAGGERLTTSQVLAAYREQHAEVCKRTIAADLAALVKKGVLDNQPDAEPPGYGLA